jgi:hypothetical protein
MDLWQILRDGAIGTLWLVVVVLAVLLVAMLVAFLA